MSGPLAAILEPHLPPAVVLVVDRLMPEEAYRARLYDDKTGKLVKAPVGKATIGYGCNVQAGWSPDLSQAVLELQAMEKWNALTTFAWFTRLNSARQSAFIDVAFNLGVEGLLHFHDTISAVAKEAWPEAELALLDSDAARELPERYKPIAQILRTGEC